MKSRSFVMLFLLSSSFMYADNSLVDLSMTQKEKEATGINRMSPQQKKAFEQWLDVWTRTVIAHSSSYHPSLTLSNWVLAWRMEQQKEKRIEGSNPIEVIGFNGSTVVLHGAKTWTIAPLDQVRVQNNWKIADRVRVTHNNDTLYPSRLLNLDSGDSATAIEG